MSRLAAEHMLYNPESPEPTADVRHSLPFTACQPVDQPAQSCCLCNVTATLSVRRMTFHNRQIRKQNSGNVPFFRQNQLTRKRQHASSQLSQHRAEVHLPDSPFCGEIQPPRCEVPVPLGRLCREAPSPPGVVAVRCCSVGSGLGCKHSEQKTMFPL